MIRSQWRASPVACFHDLSLLHLPRAISALLILKSSLVCTLLGAHHSMHNICLETEFIILITSNTITDIMSSAKRRGQARGQPPEIGGSAARRGPNPARGRVAPFDGPASRGSGSAAGTQSQVSATGSGSRRGSNAGTQVLSQAGSAAGSVAGSQSAAPIAPIARDPAREGPAPRATDAIKNVDVPASFYAIDGVSHDSIYHSLPCTCAKYTHSETTFLFELRWDVDLL